MWVSYVHFCHHPSRRHHPLGAITPLSTITTLNISGSYLYDSMPATLVNMAFHLCGIPAICFSSPGSAPALLGWLSAPLAVTSATTATSPPPLCSGFESTQKHTAGAAQCVSGCNSCGTSVPPTPRSPPLLWRSLHLNAMAALAAGTDNSPGCRHGQQPWLPARSTALAAGMANSPDNLTQPFCCQPVTIGTTSGI
ncbi:hypothetical protein CLOM_g23564 [Closterium sp. NIES-68]|nr:hypothetical protein CLOM_g23564 [Closterium sp. NIES-68]